MLAEAPAAFSGYVIASPSFSADPQLLAKLVTAAPMGKGRRVFVAAGDKEIAEIVEGAGLLATTLAAPGSTFTVEKRVFAGENHISYYPLLVPAAFAWILPPGAPPSGPPAERKAIAVAPEALEHLVGLYALPDGRRVTITRKEAKLFAELTGLPGGEVLAETPRRFFVRGFDVLLTFEGPANGPPSAVVVHINGAAMRAVRGIDVSAVPRNAPSRPW